MTIGFDGSRAFGQNKQSSSWNEQSSSWNEQSSSWNEQSSSWNKTGTENYSYQLLKALAKIDNKNSYIVYLRPDVVIPGFSSVVPNVVMFARNDQEDWPENFQFRVIPWPRFWTQGGLALQTFKDKLDVLFIPSHTLPLIRKRGLKTMITVHDLGSEYLPSMHQIKQRLYLSFMQKYQLKTASKIIAVSKATKLDLINKIGIKSDKITVVYEGYDEKRFKIQDLRFKNDIKVNSLRYFLFVGTVQPRKNLERVIRAFSTHLEGEKMQLHLRGGLKLLIAGSKGWLSDEIYKLPKKLGIEDKVKFLGYVPDEKLAYLYKGAIALVFPSLFEGFGLPILEAQACSCPVITSNLSSMPEVAGKGAILVNPYSVDDIVRGMVQVQSSKFKVQSLIKAGLQNVKRFSWEKAARETLKVLSSS
ncbi:glycosyltransferase family 4 protein [Candidatus Daviesbacteria bacterium]|nr:glycosyltransferase family 4 protein [Candidatus Daviesbacteria bacterium]